MPILDVEVVLRPGESLRPTLAADIANRAAEVFGSPPGRTWVKLHLIQANHYAEDGQTAVGRHPVFVSVLKSQPPSPEIMPAEVEQLTHAIAEACARPADNVHLIYQPAAVGRVAFGGRLVSG